MPAADPNSFFPIDVKFTANKTFCDIKVCCMLDLSSCINHVYFLVYQSLKSNIASIRDDF